MLFSAQPRIKRLAAPLGLIICCSWHSGAPSLSQDRPQPTVCPIPVGTGSEMSPKTQYRGVRNNRRQLKKPGEGARQGRAGGGAERQSEAHRREGGSDLQAPRRRGHGIPWPRNRASEGVRCLRQPRRRQRAAPDASCERGAQQRRDPDSHQAWHQSRTQGVERWRGDRRLEGLRTLVGFASRGEATGSRRVPQAARADHPWRCRSPPPSRITARAVLDRTVSLGTHASSVGEPQTRRWSTTSGGVVAAHHPIQ